MNYLEHKYMLMLSSRFRNFKKKSQNNYNFSCNFCGDSQLSKSKARGNIYDKQGNTMYYCFNCSKSLRFDDFLKATDLQYYNQYIYEKLQGNKTVEDKKFDIVKIPYKSKGSILHGLTKVSQLDIDDPVRNLVFSRQIPTNYHYKLFSCPNFMKFTNTIIPNKFSDRALFFDETRLLIPYINNNGICHGFSARALGQSNVKYIRIVVDDSIPNIYGLDTVNFNKTTYVTEGEIDSMFVNNCIASGGGDIVSHISMFDKQNIVIVYDNEKRSKETVEKIKKAIINGYKVVIWPDSIIEKDINEMVLKGFTSEYLMYILEKNTYSGLMATMKLNDWCK